MTSNQEPAAFYLETAPLEWPVTVTMPVNGGTFAQFRFTGKFARLSGEQLDELTGIKTWKKNLEAASKPPAPDEVDAEMRARQTVARLEELDAEIRAHQLTIIPDILVGWDGVLTAPGGQEVAFSSAVLTASLNGATGPALAAGIFAAVAEIRNGYRLGNSAPLPAPGQSEEPVAAAETVNP